MNYEEKYEEALKRAKYYHDRDNIEFLENIFPELKESEDERIRKAILELVKQSTHILNPMNQKSMIAWLEKKGEQKTTDKWDAEKKELKKIEQKPQRIISAEAKEALYNNAWSEEDEELYISYHK